jgi:hypothetical protein
MSFGGSMFKRFLSRFREKDTPVPIEPQPIFEEPIFADIIDDLSDEWYLARYERIGEKSVLHYKNADRYLQFVGRDEPFTFVKPNEFLTGTVLVITPEGLAYELTVSFKTGEQFSLPRYDALLSGALRKRDTNFPAGYEILRESTITSIWYINRYENRAVQVPA